MNEEKLCAASFSLENGCLTVLLPKELDHPVSDAIRAETERISRDHYIHKIIFDFGNTGFMDSSGIGLIMGRYRALGMRSDCVRAIHVGPRMKRLLRLSGLHKYIKIEE
jgi:stage II sporulation protein AA (anti-sigma F factor antagonist)